jgi:hypothetical protein
MKFDNKTLMYVALACGVAYLVLEARKAKTLGSLDHAESVAHRAIDFSVPLMKTNPVIAPIISAGLKHLIGHALFKRK